MALADAEWSKKRYIWVQLDENQFEKARLNRKNGDKLEVTIEGSGETIDVDQDNVFPVNHPQFDRKEDMAELTHLNIPSVLDLLRKRYGQDLIYTYSGLFCVVINPYKNLPIYKNETMDAYKNKRRNENQPHVYAVADNSYRDMIQNKTDQSILCTGESGAGKTVNTKRVIQHLTYIASSQNSNSNLEAQIIQSNPILEAFGNAKTIKNDNSSRFGKFIKVNFDFAGFICGASINHYILEKARVVRQAEKGKERNFHIFYQLLAGATSKQQSELNLLDHSQYKFLSNGNTKVPGIDDAKEFQDTINAMRIMKMSEDEINAIFKVLSAVLLLGNLAVTPNRRDGDSCSFTSDSMSVLNQVANLCGVDARPLEQAFLKPKMKVVNNTVAKSQNADQVRYAVESIAKATYDRLFTYLVKKINKAMQDSVSSNPINFIGILDIAGFEIFEDNSFEQLCINLTNEKLQQLFNHTLFIKEQEEYIKEGIEWTQIDFGLDLQDTINIIEGRPQGKPGILNLLDQACLFPKADDAYFNNLCKTEHDGSGHFFSATNLNDKFDFGIVHYAGDVEYNSKDWLKKNMDQLNDNVTSLFGSSKNGLMKELFADAKILQNRQRTMVIQQNTRGVTGGRSGKAKGMKRTVGALYKEELNKLLNVLNATEPNFIRCIIPNHQKKPGYLDEGLIIDQLKCNGVIEGIRIVRKGYPNKVIFSEFRQRYGLLCPRIANSIEGNNKLVASQMCSALEIADQHYKIGEHKVFFKTGVLADLEERRDHVLSTVLVKLQAVARGYLARKKRVNKTYQEQAIKVIQKNCKIYLACREWEWWMLFNKIKPLLEMRKSEDKINEFKELADSANKKNVELTNAVNRLNEDNANMREELEAHNAELIEAKERGQILEDQNREHLAEIIDLQDNCQALEDQIATDKLLHQKTTDQLREKERDIENLETDIIALANAKEALSKEKAEKDEQLNEYEIKLEDLESQNSKINKAKLDLENRRDELERELTKMQAQNSNTNKAKSALIDELEETKEALEKYRKESGDLNNQRKKLAAEINDLRAQLEAANQKIAELKAIIAKKDREIQNLTEEVESCRSEINKLKQLQQKLEGDNEILQSQYETVSKEKERERVKATNLATEVKNLKEDMHNENAQTNDVVSNLMKENQQKAQELAQLEEEYEEEIDGLNKDKNKLITEKNDLEGRVDILTSKYHQEQEKYQILKEDTDQQLDDLSQKASQQENKLRQQAKHQAQLEADIQSVRNQLAEAEAANKSLESRNKNELNNSTQLASEIEDLKRKILEGNREIEDQNNYLDEITEEKIRLANKLKNVANELSSVEDVLVTEQEDKKVKEAKIDSLNLEIDGLKRSIQSKEDEFEDLAAEIDRYRRNLKEKDEEIEELMRKQRNIEISKKKVINEKDDLQNTIENLETQVSGFPAKERKYEREIAALKDLLAKAQLEKDQSDANTREAEKRALSYKQQRDALETDADALKRRNENLTNEINELTENSANKDEVAMLTNKNRILQEQVNELKEQTDEDNETIFRLEREKEGLQNEILKESNGKKMLQNELEEIEDNNAARYNRLKADLNTKQEEAEDHQRKAAKNLAAKNAIQADLEETQAKLEGVERHLETQSNQMEQLKRRIAEADAESLNLRDYKFKYEEAIKKLDEVERRLGGDLTAINDEIEKLKRKVSQQKLELEEKDDEIEEVNANLLNAKNKQVAAENKFNELTLRMDDLEMDANKYKSDRETLAGQLNEKNAELETRLIEMEELESEKSKLKASLTNLENEMEDAVANARRSLQRKCDLLNKEKTEFQTAATEAENKLASHMREYERLKALNITATSELEDLRLRFNNVNDDKRKDTRTIRRLKVRIEELDQEVDNLRTRNKKLREELEEE